MNADVLGLMKTVGLPCDSRNLTVAAGGKRSALPTARSLGVSFFSNALDKPEISRFLSDLLGVVAREASDQSCLAHQGVDRPVADLKGLEGILVATVDIQPVLPDIPNATDASVSGSQGASHQQGFLSKEVTLQAEKAPSGETGRVRNPQMTKRESALVEVPLRPDTMQRAVIDAVDIPNPAAPSEPTEAGVSDVLSPRASAAPGERPEAEVSDGAGIRTATAPSEPLEARVSDVVDFRAGAVRSEPAQRGMPDAGAIRKPAAPSERPQGEVSDGAGIRTATASSEPLEARVSDVVDFRVGAIRSEPAQRMVSDAIDIPKPATPREPMERVLSDVVDFRAAPIRSEPAQRMVPDAADIPKPAAPGERPQAGVSDVPSLRVSAAPSESMQRGVSHAIDFPTPAKNQFTAAMARSLQAAPEPDYAAVKALRIDQQVWDGERVVPSGETAPNVTGVIEHHARVQDGLLEALGMPDSGVGDRWNVTPEFYSKRIIFLKEDSISDVSQVIQGNPVRVGGEVRAGSGWFNAPEVKALTEFTQARVPEASTGAARQPHLDVPSLPAGGMGTGEDTAGGDSGRDYPGGLLRDFTVLGDRDIPDETAAKRTDMESALLARTGTPAEPSLVQKSAPARALGLEVEQVFESVMERVKAAELERGQARFEIQTEEGTTIRVRLSVDRNLVSARIDVPNEQVRDLLAGHAWQLNQKLETGGLIPGEIEFCLAGGKGQASGHSGEALVEAGFGDAGVDEDMENLTMVDTETHAFESWA